MRIVKNAMFLLAGRGSAKVLDLLVLAIATRELGMTWTGRLLATEALAYVFLRFTDFGLYPLILRRSAQGKLERSTLDGAVRLRLFTGVVATAICFASSTAVDPEHALVLTGFFSSVALAQVHRPYAAAVTGRERFGGHLGVVAATRTLGTAVTVGALLLGVGPWGWVAGRLVAEATMLVGLFALARKVLTSGKGLSLRQLVTAGSPFWFAGLAGTLTSRSPTLVVSALIGPSAVTVFELASRVARSVVALTGSLGHAAFARWARGGRRRLTARAMRPFYLLGFGWPFVLVLAAPLLMPLLMPRAPPRSVTIAIVLGLAVGVRTLQIPLVMWLQARGREKWLAAHRTAGATLLMLMLVPMTLSLDLMGAVGAIVVEASVAYAALWVLHAADRWQVQVLGPWLVARLPFGRALIEAARSRLPARLAELDEEEGLACAELSGSSLDPSALRPGYSDVDLLCVSEHATPSANAALRRRLGGRVGKFVLPGPVHPLVVPSEVVEASRARGHPLLSREPRRLVTGVAQPQEETDAVTSDDWRWRRAARLIGGLQLRYLSGCDDAGNIAAARLRPLVGHATELLAALGYDGRVGASAKPSWSRAEVAQLWAELARGLDFVVPGTSAGPTALRFGKDGVWDAWGEVLAAAAAAGGAVRLDASGGEAWVAITEALDANTAERWLAEATTLPAAPPSAALPAPLLLTSRATERPSLLLEGPLSDWAGPLGPEASVHASLIALEDLVVAYRWPSQPLESREARLRGRAVALALWMADGNAPRDLPDLRRRMGERFDGPWAAWLAGEGSVSIGDAEDAAASRLLALAKAAEPRP